MTIDIVKDRLKQDDVQKGIILDGFPRTVKKAEEMCIRDREKFFLQRKWKEETNNAINAKKIKI